MSVLKDLSNSNFNECTGTFEFSENKFTALYKKDQWDDNMMRSSYMHNLKRLLQTRGFKVIRAGLKKKLEQMQVEYDWNPIKDLVKQGIASRAIRRMNRGDIELFYCHLCNQITIERAM